MGFGRALVVVFASCAFAGAAVASETCVLLDPHYVAPPDGPPEPGLPTYEASDKAFRPGEVVRWISNHYMPDEPNPVYMGCAENRAYFHYYRHGAYGYLGEVGSSPAYWLDQSGAGFHFRCDEDKEESCTLVRTSSAAKAGLFEIRRVARNADPIVCIDQAAGGPLVIDGKVVTPPDEAPSPGCFDAAGSAALIAQIETASVLEREVTAEGGGGLAKVAGGGFATALELVDFTIGFRTPD